MLPIGSIVYLAEGMGNALDEGISWIGAEFDDGVKWLKGIAKDIEKNTKQVSSVWDWANGN